MLISIMDRSLDVLIWNGNRTFSLTLQLILLNTQKNNQGLFEVELIARDRSHQSAAESANQVATTPLEHDIAFLTDGANGPNQLIPSNMTTRKQIPYPVDPELQPYSEAKTYFDLDWKDLAVYLRPALPSSPIPQGHCKPYSSSLGITRMKEQ
ncbi:hypothetical protein WISP_56895 [Willisornis vidua]|uniref:Uncharacterized protein n=1 Tax=Willisornis vidua TaxID=1566151 RepID=A0ABQ9DCG6_9PASS|nr:hypothetical protein WISP_56895 [Willisornis vidua]